MNSKQLATVLIKLLGLSLLVREGPGFLAAMIAMAVRAMNVDKNMSYDPAEIWLYPLTSGLFIPLGIYLIVRTRRVVECLFKNEEI
jgi:hypothetical protein